VARTTHAPRSLLIIHPNLRGREDTPAGHEHCGDHGANDEAVHAKDRETAQRGDQHQVVRHLDVLADEDRAHDVVDQPDDEHAPRDQHDPLPYGAGRQQVHGHRQPDQREQGAALLRARIDMVSRVSSVAAMTCWGLNASTPRRGLARFRGRPERPGRGSRPARRPE